MKQSRYIILSEGSTHTWVTDRFIPGFCPYEAITFKKKREALKEIRKIEKNSFIALVPVLSFFEY